ncbi:MAG: hypothetical protein HUJ99_04995, partial [Bacteroidaceae bacterium]|nr:hypothetical protein [Bacteroidaceae bacterium]
MALNYGQMILLLISISATLAAINGRCSSGNGVCVSTSSCLNSGGSYVSGKCPNDSSDIKCCNKNCNVNGKSGQCMFKSSCSGTTYSGYCPGGSDFVCCISSGGTSNTATTTSTTTSNYGKMSTKFAGCTLSKTQFVSKVTSYCKNYSKLASALCKNAESVYDISKNANVNPLLVIVRAIVEGNSPGSSKNNYWGIGCVNGGGYSACTYYSSLTEGIKGFARIVTSYSDLAGMMSKYAYIGKYWYNPGSWSDGGCIYFPYIKKYMSSSRGNTVTKICAKSTSCTTSGGDCSPTTSEDQKAYASWQVQEK